MKRLYVSIIISVLSALFIINLGVDHLAHNATSLSESPDIALHKKLLEGIHLQLDDTMATELDNTMQSLAAQFDVVLSLQHSNDMVLPESLHAQLDQSGGLLLASDTDAYLLKRLSNHPEKLIKLQVETLTPAPNNIDFALTALLYLGVCLVIILWLFPLTRRLYLLTQSAAKIGAGELQTRLPASRFSYIQPLESSFNRMAAQIETLVADNKVLARSLSHDIRTPLACLRFGVEAALDATDADKKNLYINRMDAEITRMEDMTSAFLEYAALERKGLKLNLVLTDINHLVHTLVQDFTSLAEQHNIKVICHTASSSASAQVDSHWCYLAIQNIVSNAIRYAESQVQVTVDVIDKKAVAVRVEDDGKGISAGEITQIFRPFIKLDAERTREEGHFGLGLATTMKVMEWHHGTVRATNSTSLSGLCCELRFLQHSD